MAELKPRCEQSAGPAMTKTVIILIGLPGSGKSSLSRSLASSAGGKSSSSSSTIIHIEWDHIARGLSDDQQQQQQDDALQAWRQTRSVALQEFRSALLELPKDSSSMILLDDNFHLRSMRKEVFKVCQNHFVENEEQVFLGIVWVDCNLEICLKRNRQRSSTERVPDRVIEKMNTTLEPPNGDRVYWENCWTKVDGGDGGVDNNLRQIQSWLSTNNESLYAVQRPAPEIDPEEIERERIATRENRIHQIDQTSRKWIGRVAQIDRKATGKANDSRKKLIQRIKTEDLAIEDMVAAFCEGVCEDWTHDNRAKLEASLLESVNHLRSC